MKKLLLILLVAVSCNTTYGNNCDTIPKKITPNYYPDFQSKLKSDTDSTEGYVERCYLFVLFKEDSVIKISELKNAPNSFVQLDF